MPFQEGVARLGARVLFVEGDDAYKTANAAGKASMQEGTCGEVTMVGATGSGIWVRPDAGGMDQWLDDTCWVQPA